MKARLISLSCFVLTMLPQKSPASSSIWSVLFFLPTGFCVPECHQKGVKSSTAEKGVFFFFSVSPFASAERKIDQGKEFTIAEVTVQFVHYIQVGRS